MKTIPVEQLDERLGKALEQQDEHELISLTKNAATVGWLLRVPETLKGSEPDAVFFGEGPEGRVFVIVQAKHPPRRQIEEEGHGPVFGAGQGTLTILSDDDEHLKDFKDYVE